MKKVLKRHSSFLTRPLEPRERQLFCRGDLIEFFPYTKPVGIQVNETKKKSPCLAIIQRALPSDYGGRATIIGVSREEGQKWLYPSSIAFHYSKFTDIESEGDLSKICQKLTIFEEEIIAEYDKVNSIVTEIAKRHSRKFACDQIIFHEELTEQVFGKKNGLTPVQSYNLYKAISHTMLRDNHSRLSLTYRSIPEKILKCISFVRSQLRNNTEIVNRFRDNLQSGLRDDSKDAFSRAFVLLMEFYVICHESVWGDKMKELMGKVLPVSSNLNDVVALLQKLDGFPKSMGIPFRQSALSNNHLPAMGKHHIVKQVKKQPPLLIQPVEMFAIDSKETVEIDDAISHSVSDGSEWIHIHVADPSRYIQLGSGVELMARDKVSSLYLPELSSPMLPWEYTNVSGLNPQASFNHTLTFSARLSKDGDFLDYKMASTAVLKMKRLSYEECDLLLQSGSNSSLSTIERIAKAHYKYRVSQGMLDLSLPKPHVTVAGNGQSITIQHKLKQSAAESMVSECMVIAGRIAAMIASNYSIPMPYRYHLPPKPPFPAQTDHLIPTNVSSDSLSHKLQLIAAIRPSAIDIVPQKHWAMALEKYVKVTSPLRRYLDLVSHLQLKSILTQTSAPFTREHLTCIIPKVYVHEQYIKRLQQSSVRFWIFVYLQRLLNEQKEVEMEGICVGNDPPIVYFTEPLYTSLFVRLPTSITSYKIYRFSICQVDPFKGFVEAKVIK